MGRMDYAVSPGLYAVGSPTHESPVLVSANYKMSFDRLRSQLSGVDAWVLVLDTRGINVWCAAGKGTFGTLEMVERVCATRLSEVVSHRTLVVPQLGAPGVCAQAVKAQSGFEVVYGPVRADSLPQFLAAGMRATPNMRRVRFPMRDRVALIPIELLVWARTALCTAVAFFLLSGLGRHGYSLSRAASVGVWQAAMFLSAYVAGAALTPALLPWLPGRSFSSKGAWAGVALLLSVGGCAWIHPGLLANPLDAAAWALIVPTVSSFMAMNFTGASTYTSLSGVRREMRVAVPIQAVCGVVGVGLWLAGRFV